VQLAAERARRRAGEEPDRTRDAYERDDGLQLRTAQVYSGLAALHWHGPWTVAGRDVEPAALAADLLA
jgi:dTMP kinase